MTDTLPLWPAQPRTEPLDGYPQDWPKPDPMRPSSLVSRVTEQDKADLYHRRITTRALALKLKCREASVSRLFPGKVPPTQLVRKTLLDARKAYRMHLARKVLLKELQIKQAAPLARTTYRSMARAVQALRRLEQAL